MYEQVREFGLLSAKQPRLLIGAVFICGGNLAISGELDMSKSSQIMKHNLCANRRA